MFNHGNATGYTRGFCTRKFLDIATISPTTPPHPLPNKSGMVWKINNYVLSYAFVTGVISMYNVTNRRKVSRFLLVYQM